KRLTAGECGPAFEYTVPYAPGARSDVAHHALPVVHEIGEEQVAAEVLEVATRRRGVAAVYEQRVAAPHVPEAVRQRRRRERHVAIVRRPGRGPETAFEGEGNRAFVVGQVDVRGPQ